MVTAVDTLDTPPDVVPTSVSSCTILFMVALAVNNAAVSAVSAVLTPSRRLVVVPAMGVVTRGTPSR